jgi:hypothetical protein
MAKEKLSAIEKIMDGYNPHRQLLEQTRKLVDKWEPTGLLDGMGGETQTHGMAVLLENQARQLIDEASKTGTSSNSEEWSGVALPLVRRIFGELAAQDFVSVQPMNLPSGLIFFLDFKYGTAQPNFGKGDDIFGVTSGSGDATQGLYGAGRFGYSINDQSVAISAVTTASATWKDVDFEPDLSASVAAGNLYTATFVQSSASNPDLDGVRAFELSGSGDNEITKVYPAYTQASASLFKFVIDPASGSFGMDNPALRGSVTLKYHKAPTDVTRGDFEATAAQTDANPETDMGIPEIDIQMRSVAIVAKTRKLKAVWTPELAQDLNAYHSVDAEAELTSMLSEYVSMEIDLEILDMLRANAVAKKEYWSAKVGFDFDAVSNSFKEITGNSNAYTKGAWFQTLGNKIQAVSNAIHQKTLRGGANWLVVSPETATILESIPGYATTSDGNATTSQYAMGVQKVGLLNNRFNVYKNPYMQENTILLGFRGSNFLETGAVYAPYVPLIMTPLVYDPKNFTPRKGVMTRYAKKMVRPEFYGTVVVADVDFV